MKDKLTLREIRKLQFAFEDKALTEIGKDKLIRMLFEYLKISSPSDNGSERLGGCKDV